MHIAFIAYNYPSQARPYYGVFVRNLVRAMARNGTRCTVINPVSIFHRRYGVLDPITSTDHIIRDNPIRVIKPRYLSASSKKLWFLNSEYITQHNFDMAVYRVLKNSMPSPDVLYGHFVYPAGAVAARLGVKMNIPSMVAVGEDLITDFSRDILFKRRWDLGKLNGVLCVSTANKMRCINELRLPEDKIKMFPNGVDTSLFYARDRDAMREKYHFPYDKSIVAFLGPFEDRKGPNRILQAIRGIDKVKVIFIGAGAMPLEGEGILFKGFLEHEKIPEVLSAADMFVLPTLSEGSCNSIIEAMACGLPVVTSNGKFNDDIVDDRVAIRVDPLNINNIREAITTLCNNNEMRKMMSVNAIEQAKKYDINLRAKNILKWIGEITNRGNNGQAI